MYREKKEHTGSGQNYKVLQNNIEFGWQNKNKLGTTLEQWYLYADR